MSAVDTSSGPPNLRDRTLRLAAACSVVMAGAAALTACADEVREAVISELAIGSWGCAPTAGGSPEDPFTIRIEDDGTFLVSALAPAGGLPTARGLSGTWAVEGGDLEWGIDLREDVGNVTVEGFEALTLDSRELTLTNAGLFEANDGTGDPPDEQEVLVNAEGTDSVTLTVPGGTPWTCARQ